MAKNDNDKERPSDPRPSESPKTEINKRHRELNNWSRRENYNPDWSNKSPLTEGYRPIEDTTDPTPPSDSATSDE